LRASNETPVKGRWPMPPRGGRPRRCCRRLRDRRGGARCRPAFRGWPHRLETSVNPSLLRHFSMCASRVGYQHFLPFLSTRSVHCPSPNLPSISVCLCFVLLWGEVISSAEFICSLAACALIKPARESSRNLIESFSFLLVSFLLSNFTAHCILSEI